MNNDRVKGVAKNMSGKVQEEAGKPTGNRTQQAKGLVNQAKGKAQQHVGNVKELVKELVKDAKKV